MSVQSANPVSGARKPPALLLGAALVFWGWQSGFVLPGFLMAIVVEAARWTKLRWDFSNEDFKRIWTFCTLLLLAAGVYAFTSNEGPADFRGLFENPNLATERNATAATSRTAASLFRWLPMVFFLFVGAQVYSTRAGIPLEILSLILQRRWKKAQREGRPLPPSRVVDISHIYFALCVASASVHVSEDQTFFWGACVLLAWALWPQRSRRYGLAVWVGCVGAVIALGYFGQLGMAQLQSYLSKLDPQWLTFFSRRGFDPAQSRTELGHVGRIKKSGKIVIRLNAPDSRPPPLLREASYRSFKTQSWTADIQEGDFSRVQEEAPNSGTWVLLRGKTNSGKVGIACYLDGGKALLPLPSGSGRLERLFAYDLLSSGLGAVLAQGPGLVLFDAMYGPGEMMDSHGTTNEDLAIPAREMPALDQVVAQLGANPKTVDEAVKTLNRYFLGNFSYSTWQEAPPARSQDTPLGRFLLQTHSGHCEYFATAGVLLLRRLGIPARYAVGYAVHEGSGDKYVVRQRDAHAWCLAWDADAAMWRDVDFTPGSWVQAEADHASAFQSLSDFWSRVRFEFAKVRWGQTRLRQYLLWAIVPVLVLLLYQIIFRRRGRSARTGGRPEEAIDWPGLDSEFYQLERMLATRGKPRGTSEPLSPWLARAVGDPALTDLEMPLRELLRLHYRYRFDPRGLTAQERAELREAARDCLQALAAPAPRK
jgi:protein-glutamine gamma-glutamyltransferase